MNKLTVRDIDVDGKRVLVRVDFNVREGLTSTSDEGKLGLHGMRDPTQANDTG